MFSFLQQLRANEASGLTIAQHFGNIDLESMVVMGPEEAMFYSYAVRKKLSTHCNTLQHTATQNFRHKDRPAV